MNIAEMHVWFRQYAQQMGLQNVRAILPEQIDLLINTSITDTINQLIRENIGLTNDRVITDNSKLGQINALRTLYKVDLIELSPIDVNPENGDYRTFGFNPADRLTGKMSTNIERINSEQVEVKSTMPDYMFLVDFSINYKATSTGYHEGDYAQPKFDNNAIETTYFPVRFIDDAYLADTLNDFVLKNRLRSPIIVTYNNGTFDLYIDKFHKVTKNNQDFYCLDNSLIPYKLRMSYIGKPAKVRYSEDIGGENVDCDLPESMHVDILKHAVDLYNIAIQGNLYAAQQQQQAQNRELSRNQARPDNEGYQS